MELILNGDNRMNLDKIGWMIIKEKSLKDWEYESVGKVEKAIIRIAVYEMVELGQDSKIVIKWGNWAI